MGISSWKGGEGIHYLLNTYCMSDIVLGALHVVCNLTPSSN